MRFSATSLALLLARSQRPLYSSFTFSTTRLWAEGTTKLPRLYVGPSLDTPLYVNRGDFLDTLKGGSLIQDAVTLRKDAIVTLTVDQSHYLTKVLRFDKKKDPQLRITEGKASGEWLAELVSVDGKRRNTECVVQCVERLRSPLIAIGKPAVWLCTAPPKKKERLRWLIEKCTELDVTGFILLDTEYSEATVESFQKMYSYAIEAMEQSERDSIPTFLAISEASSDVSSDHDILMNTSKKKELPRTKLGDLLSLLKESSDDVDVLVCRERKDAPSILKALTEPKSPILLLVGPEGGWSENEVIQFDALEDTKSSFRSVALGSTILRAETAAMAAVAACNFSF